MSRRVFNSSLITHHYITLLGPFERALAPRIVIADDEYADEDEHLKKRELCEREVAAHEDDRPGEQEDRLNVEYEEQHRDNVVAHGEAVVRLGRRVDAALVRAHLHLAVEVRSDEAA